MSIALAKKLSGEHLILGVDERHLRSQIDEWLARHPSIFVVAMSNIQREPTTMLTRLGGPRFSVLVRYDQKESDHSATRPRTIR
jgi:hypothetical protein